MRDGRRIVVVTINAPDDWKDHSTLVEKSFRDYCVTRLIDPGQCMATVPVIGSDITEVDLLAAEGFSFSLRQDEKVSFKLSGPAFVYAPFALLNGLLPLSASTQSLCGG